MIFFLRSISKSLCQPRKGLSAWKNGMRNAQVHDGQERFSPLRSMLLVTKQVHACSYPHYLHCNHLVTALNQKSPYLAMTLQ